MSCTENKTKKLYLCGVNFQHELGEACGGVELYSSVEDLKNHSSCWKNCGIVELEVDTEKSKWLKEQNLFTEEGTVSYSEINTPAYKLKEIEHIKAKIKKEEELLNRLKALLTKLNKEKTDHE